MSDRDVIELRKRVARLEQLVTHLYEYVGMGMPAEETPGLSPEIKDLVRRRKKIEAIKLYREETGCGLKEAKEFIDNLERQL